MSEQGYERYSRKNLMVFSGPFRRVLKNDTDEVDGYMQDRDVEAAMGEAAALSGAEPDFFLTVFNEENRKLETCFVWDDAEGAAKFREELSPEDLTSLGVEVIDEGETLDKFVAEVNDRYDKKCVQEDCERQQWLEDHPDEANQCVVISGTPVKLQNGRSQLHSDETRAVEDVLQLVFVKPYGHCGAQFEGRLYLAFRFKNEFDANDFTKKLRRKIESGSANALKIEDDGPLVSEMVMKVVRATEAKRIVNGAGEWQQEPEGESGQDVIAEASEIAGAVADGMGEPKNAE